MPPAMVLSPLPESPSVLSVPESPSETRRFGDIRGLQWRISLGVLPSSNSIDDLRRATANSRRRYANLRGRLLVDPHLPKDGGSPPNLIMDNPLSQNPDSTWSRFFRNAELERMVDQDLSRLYPEHGGYFQTPGFQGLLRRILLLWCLKHPECGYRQGMHELLAPLLYVLQVDVEHLSAIRKLYEDHFTDRFDGLFCQENDHRYSFDMRKSTDSEDDIGSCGDALKIQSLDELDPNIRALVLLGDAYGAEGELGVVLSDKFMEHDAYCMFEALMSGAHGSVAMADFFSYSPVAGSNTGLPPVIEASNALYHLLYHVDSSLHSHLVDLGVEPQYFALRWFRVLFGREFSLDNLLIIWDEIFLSDNSKKQKLAEDTTESGFMILQSPRGAFITAMAVAMLLRLRSSLLATENPTICLQRLLNFPGDTDIDKLLAKAKSLQDIALSTEISSSIPSFVWFHNQAKSISQRSTTHASDSDSPRTPLKLLTDSYWEEKWRVAHSTEELKQDGAENQVPAQKKKWTEKVNVSLKRTESAPSPSTTNDGKKENKEAVRRSLLEDLCKELGSEVDTENLYVFEQDNRPVVVEREQQDDGSECCNNYFADVRGLSVSTRSEGNSPIFSGLASPRLDVNRRNYSEKSSIPYNYNLSFLETEINETGSPLPVSDCPENLSHTSSFNNDPLGNSASHPKWGKLNKFQWFFSRLGRNSDERTSVEGGSPSQDAKPAKCENQSHVMIPSSSIANGHCSPVRSQGDSPIDQNMVGTIRNIGQSMLEHIQVIESSFQQEQGASKDVVVGKGQLAAMTAALDELRKISNLLSEM
ncbi:hypothetical protein HN51_002121 [Arachis hypogaea]|uniref:Uncharacterized protein LOC107496268 n=2 Tax=Arachis TaxID=3817 RepID=A0A6P4E373_ARADU|nr:uncharacterized protein LOC107496268 [Arachis duranensis]XP_025606786.1 TBC1 domain family member 5 homolog A [Arachis hypogaea]XP_029154672.1 TBC1 domain family member 5 homolog A [Arachis hypogaea]XP_052117395.1 uncharacterized protein LOC107496268 [Arachis duranensis]QHO50279.1 uncharacterized protein DS421_1g21230 [Arachis hypogaea]RYR77081.1 hypothetical protein Ahy_A01g001558 [Arachis hypogaea]